MKKMNCIRRFATTLFLAAFAVCVGTSLCACSNNSGDGTGYDFEVVGESSSSANTTK